MHWTLLATLYLEKHPLMPTGTGSLQANLKEKGTGLIGADVLWQHGDTALVTKLVLVKKTQKRLQNAD